MAGLPPTTAVMDRTDEVGSTLISVSILRKGPGTQASWSRFSEDLRASLQQSGFSQPDEYFEEGLNPTAPPDPWRTLAPGMTVRASEYAERYAALDLERFRDLMPAAVFLAYVRNVGILEGNEAVNVDELVDEEAE